MGGRREVSIIFYRPVTRSDLKQERSFFRGSVSSFLQLVVAGRHLINTSLVNSLLIGRHAEMNLKSRTTNRFIFQIIGCLPFTKSFRKIRSLQGKISWSNVTSERVVLVFRFQALALSAMNENSFGHKSLSILTDTININQNVKINS